MTNIDNKINILVCTHKKDINTRNEGIYRAIHAGKALHPELNLDCINDNTGINISEKNPYYCELTALYWGWKNLNGIQYCGLNHYRRYFSIDINAENIDSIMKGYDMIVAKSETMISKRERGNNLALMTTLEDYYVFVDTILYLYPDCKNAFIEYFYNSRKSYPYQMFIARKELYNEYCEFLFSILFETEKRIKNHEYTRLKRTLGYLGEWMLGLFIYYKKLNVKETPISILIEEEKQNKLKPKIALTIRRMIQFMLDFTYKKPKEIIVPDMVKVGFINDGIELKSLK